MKDSAKDSAQWLGWGVFPPSCLEQVGGNCGSVPEPRKWFTAWVYGVSSCLGLDKQGLFDCVPRAG